MTRLLLGLLFLASWRAAWAVPITVTITPTADAFVRSQAASPNYGAAGALSVSGSAAVNGSGVQRGILDTFMKFNVAGVVSQMDAQFGAGNWEFTEAVLRLTEDPAPNNAIFNRGIGQFEIRWIATDGWLEGTGTPSAPTTNGVRYSDKAALLNPAVDATLGTFSNTLTTAAHLYTLDLVGPFVDDLLAAADVSFFLTAADPSVGFTFNSRTVSDPVWETRWSPTLHLTADLSQSVPEPATATLLLLGVLGAFGRRWGGRRAR